MKRFFSQLAIYFLLIVGSTIFLVPLFWMMSTALKPIDQTMAMPPTWIPFRLYTQLDGKRVSVKTGETVTSPSLLVTVTETGQKRIASPDQVVKGKLVTRDSSGKQVKLPVTVLKEIPASKQDPWIRVTPEDVMAAIQAGKGDASLVSSWEVVPEKSLEKERALRWDNFGKAIKALGVHELSARELANNWLVVVPGVWRDKVATYLYEQMTPKLKRIFSLNFTSYLKNTLILCILTVIGTVFSSALAAYGFARIPWRGRNKVFVIALATMMIPFPVVMVPIYCLFRWVGWIGTLRPLWVGSFVAGAFNVFLLRQFFMTIPKDLSDAARIDGCSEWRIFWQIILPLCRPALMVVGLFQFMGTWNDFLGPLIYLTNQKDFTLALGLQFYQSQQGGTEWHYLMAASTLVVLPIIVLFFFTQKTFIEGISMTGIKG
jgi:multiple sugar transport system permease protein